MHCMIRAAAGLTVPPAELADIAATGRSQHNSSSRGRICTHPSNGRCRSGSLGRVRRSCRPVCACRQVVQTVRCSVRRSRKTAETFDFSSPGIAARGSRRRTRHRPSIIGAAALRMAEILRCWLLPLRFGGLGLCGSVAGFCPFFRRSSVLAAAERILSSCSASGASTAVPRSRRRLRLDRVFCRHCSEASPPAEYWTSRCSRCGFRLDTARWLRSAPAPSRCCGVRSISLVLATHAPNPAPLSRVRSFEEIRLLAPKPPF